MKITKPLLFIIFLSFTQAYSQNCLEEKSIKEFNSNISMGSVEDYLNTFNFNSVDQFISANTHTMSNSKAFMVRSRSLQQSTLTAPRVITFPDKQGDSYSTQDFIYSYTHPQLKGGDKIEVVLGDITQDYPESLKYFEIDFKEGKSHLIKNPKRCSKCHGIESRPIWNDEQFWPGALGGGSIYRTDIEKNKLFAAIKKQSRYKFVNYEVFNDKTDFGGGLFQFNLIFKKYNIQRLGDKIRQTPNYKEYKYAIAGSLLKCDPILDFLPDKILNQHTITSFLNLNGHSKNIKKFNYYVNHPLDFLGPKTDEDINLHKKFTSILKNEIVDWIKMAKSKDNKIYYSFILDDFENFLLNLKQGKTFTYYNKFNQRDLVNLRFLFESRGIGMADWSMNIMEGDYNLKSETFNIENENNLFDSNPKLIKHYINATLLNNIIYYDKDLSKSFIIKRLYDNIYSKNLEVDTEEWKIAIQKQKTEVCNLLKSKSLNSLSSLEKIVTFNIDTQKNLSNENWQHHFSNIAKLNFKHSDLPSNPKSQNSCTQCHFNYKANYTGPVFNRFTKDYPLEFMYCANCHSDKKANVGGYIPFNDQLELNKFVNSNPSIRTRIEYRLSDKAVSSLDHMPPVVHLKKKQKQSILKYLKSFEKK